MARHSWAAVNGLPLSDEGDRQDVKTGYTVKVAEIGRPDTPSGSNSGGCDDPVVRSDVLPGSGKLSPDACMRASGQKLKRQRRKRSYDRLDEGLTPGTVFAGCAMHAMQQLRGRNCGDADFLVPAQLFR
jgi:hypothetical protein